MLQYFPLLLLFLFASCHNAENEHAGALPHTVDNHKNTDSTPLSDIDRELIASAKGRSVEPLSYNDLTNRLELSGGKLHIFNFWRIDCIPCRQNNGHLEKIQAELGEDKIKIIHINMDENARRKDVNIFVRQEGFIGEIYQLEKAESGAEKNTESIDWNTELPALYMVDNAQGIKFYYQQSFDFEELKAVISAIAM